MPFSSQGAGAATIVLLAVHGTTYYHATDAAIEDTESFAEVGAAQANFQSITKERETTVPLIRKTAHQPSAVK